MPVTLVEAISLAAVLAMVAAFTVESSSWWIKAACTPSTIGLYVSRSNIYLYFGRFFALAYNALIAFGIENGAGAALVAITLAIGFACSCAAHFMLFRGGRSTLAIVGLLSRVLILPKPDLTIVRPDSGLDRSIVSSSAISSLCFSLGISLPLMLAVFIPQYRMSLSYLGQTVNAVGTILLLFLVDQKLFRSLDKGTLAVDLLSYSVGRTTAFGLASLVCLGLYLAVPGRA